MSDKDTDNARNQAKAQYESIVAMLAALNLDWDRLKELREERKDLVQDLESASAMGGEAEATAKLALDGWDADNLEELNELTGNAGEYADRDAAETTIKEDPLSVLVRSGWYEPGSQFNVPTPTPEEFELLLCTGGPAVRICGDLGEHGEPTRAYMQYQDWNVPWTDYVDADGEVLLQYAQQFYYGE